MLIFISSLELANKFVAKNCLSQMKEVIRTLTIWLLHNARQYNKLSSGKPRGIKMRVLSFYGSKLRGIKPYKFRIILHNDYSNPCNLRNLW